jgi:hypothetical protein
MLSDLEKMDRGVVVYNYNHDGYVVMVIGFHGGCQQIMEEYAANDFMLGEPIAAYAKATALEMAEEYGIPADKVEMDEDIDVGGIL